MENFSILENFSKWKTFPFGKNRDPPQKKHGFSKKDSTRKLRISASWKELKMTKNQRFYRFANSLSKGFVNFCSKFHVFFQNFDFFVFFLVLTTAQWGKIDFSKNWNFEFTPLNSHVMCVFSWNMMVFSNLGLAS